MFLFELHFLCHKFDHDDCFLSVHGMTKVDPNRLISTSI